MTRRTRSIQISDVIRAAIKLPSGLDITDQANTARNQANSAFDHANTAYSHAGNAFNHANNAHNQANAAYSAANTKLNSSGGTISGNLIVTGNLFVEGDSTSFNVASLLIEDSEIYLNNNQTTPSLNASIFAERGSSTDTFIRWNESTDKWGWSDDGSAFYSFDDVRSGLATTNTTFGTINTNIGTAYSQANAAYSQANAAYGQANSAFTAANNRVLKSGDTMTGNLIISAAAGAASGTFAGGVSLLRVQGSTSAFSEPRIDLGEQSLSPTAYIASKNEGNGGGSLIFGNRDTSSSGSTLTERLRIAANGQINFAAPAGGWESRPTAVIASGGDGYLFVRHIRGKGPASDTTDTLYLNYNTSSGVYVGGSLSATSQLISQVGTGTAPLAVSSTTAVANLNADMVDGYHASTLVQTSNSSAQTTLWNPYGDYYTTVWGVGNDYNNFLNAGSYHADPNATNRPEATYGYVRVWRHVGGRYNLQEFTPSSNPSNTYRRVGTDNGSGGYNWSGWAKYWSDGNDGSGSGLDADLLDGIQGSSFLRSDAAATNTVGLYAPAFYDSNNTGYYSDPAANSILNTQYNYVYFFHGVGSNSGNANHQYAIYQEAGAWAHPYPDLNIAYHTGIKIGAYFGYNGTRFYNNSDFVTQIASVGDGDNNFRSYYNVIAYASDGRLKENLQPITNAIEKVKKITGMTFDWKPMVKDLGFEPSSIHETGVIAQDVESVLPEAVEIAPFDYDWKKPNKSKSGEKYLTVKYEKLVPLLIQAIKEQQEQIEELKSLIKEKL